MAHHYLEYRMTGTVLLASQCMTLVVAMSLREDPYVKSQESLKTLQMPACTC